MVVFEGGKPAKSEYRKFKIRSKDTPDDFAMMRETLSRRLAKLPRDTEQETSIEAEHDLDSSLVSTKPAATTWPRPDLIVIDGGKGQLHAALDAQQNFQFLISNFQINSKSQIQNKEFQPIPMIGLAKRIEEIFLPNNPEPIVLGYDHPSLQLLQRLRDEAHRFGITFHRQLRSKQATKSALDTIPGIGPKKKLLKQKLGTVASIKAASLEELSAIIGPQKAELIKKHL
jgi:excinuclease ABC subunit C